MYSPQAVSADKVKGIIILKEKKYLNGLNLKEKKRKKKTRVESFDVMSICIVSVCVCFVYTCDF